MWWTYGGAVAARHQAQVDAAVQVNLGGVCSEGEHPEGETTWCADAILKHLHCVVIGVGAPRGGITYGKRDSEDNRYLWRRVKNPQDEQQKKVEQIRTQIMMVLSMCDSVVG